MTVERSDLFLMDQTWVVGAGKAAYIDAICAEMDRFGQLFWVSDVFVDAIKTIGMRY